MNIEMDVNIEIDGIPFHAFTTTVFGHLAVVLETEVDSDGQPRFTSVYYYGPSCLREAAEDLRARGFRVPPTV